MFDELHQRQSKTITSSNPADAEKLKRSTLNTFPKIRRLFRALEANKDVQQRGYELERLVLAIGKLTFGISVPAYTAKRDGNGVIRQIDGFFYHRSDCYRVECKWQGEAATQNDILIFSNKLDVASVSGLFISISGFKSTAIDQVRELRKEKAILLMDGDEARALFNTHIRFDEIMTRKRQAFDQLSNPYCQILPN